MKLSELISCTERKKMGLKVCTEKKSQDQTLHEDLLRLLTDSMGPVEGEGSVSSEC